MNVVSIARWKEWGSINVVYGETGRRRTVGGQSRIIVKFCEFVRHSPKRAKVCSADSGRPGLYIPEDRSPTLVRWELNQLNKLSK